MHPILFFCFPYEPPSNHNRPKGKWVAPTQMQMPEPAPKPALRLDLACASAVAALEHDPFYRCICYPYADDPACRRAFLEQYFAYSIQEGKDDGRCVHLRDHSQGVAVWLLPQTRDAHSRATRNKRAFLQATLESEGCANYYRIMNFMSAKSKAIVGHDAWYLSIVAVNPTLHGKGLGRLLLEPTIAEADRLAAVCYLETFSPRNLSFYERLGFVTKARFTEPTTGSDYSLMVRYPG
jgi:GNAT superfamily N-acetyltransferase